MLTNIRDYSTSLRQHTVYLFNQSNNICMANKARPTYL